MKTCLHAAAGTIALLCILSFWLSTLVAEIFLSNDAITTVKHSILRAMWLLVPAMAITGASGFSMAARHSGRLLDQKKKRMPLIALNGLLILLPSAVFLHAKAAAGAFDTMFYAVQGLELLAGAINLALLSLNLRDGLKLAGRLRKPATRSTSHR